MMNEKKTEEWTIDNRNEGEENEREKNEGEKNERELNEQ